MTICDKYRELAPPQQDILLTPIKRITVPNGDILHGIKISDNAFRGFGEAYFSYINYKALKAWRLHKSYTANFVIPFGKVRINLYKEKSPGNLDKSYPKSLILSSDQNDYQRLTISPGIWYGFEGLAEPMSIIFSFLNGEHSQDEQQTMALDNFPYPWIRD